MNPTGALSLLQNAGGVFHRSCQSRELHEVRQMRELRQMLSLPKLCLNLICQGWYNRAVHQILASDQVAGDDNEDMSSL